MIFFIYQLLFAHEEKFTAKFDNTSIQIRERNSFFSVGMEKTQKEIEEIETKIKYFLNEYSQTMEKIIIEDFYFINCHNILDLISDLSKFPKLTTVSIERTNLKAQVPPLLLNNNQLKKIYLQNNHLYGALPQKIILDSPLFFNPFDLNLKENYFIGDQPEEIKIRGRVYDDDISNILSDNFFIKKELSNTVNVFIKKRNVNLPMLLSVLTWYLNETSIRIEEVGIFNVWLQSFNKDTDSVDIFFQGLNELIIKYPNNGLQKLTLEICHIPGGASSLSDYEQLYSQLTLLYLGGEITFKDGIKFISNKYPDLKIIMP